MVAMLPMYFFIKDKYETGIRKYFIVIVIVNDNRCNRNAVPFLETLESAVRRHIDD